MASTGSHLPAVRVLAAAHRRLPGTLNPSSGMSACSCRSSTLACGGCTSRDRTALFARYSWSACSVRARCARICGTDTLAGAGVGRLPALRTMFVLYGAVAAGLAPVQATTDVITPRYAQSAGTVGLRAAWSSSLRRCFRSTLLPGARCPIAAGLVAVPAIRAILTAAGSFFFWRGCLPRCRNWRHPGSPAGSACSIPWLHAHSVQSCLDRSGVRIERARCTRPAAAACGLSQMDVPTRSRSSWSGDPARTGGGGSFTAVPRSLAAAVSPSLSGALFAAGWFAAPLVACGVLKIAYDLALLGRFKASSRLRFAVPAAARAGDECIESVLVEQNCACVYRRSAGPCVVRGQAMHARRTRA